MTSNQILRLPAVMLRTGLSRSTIYSRIKEGLLKTPIKLGSRAVGWLNSDVDDFINSCVSASRQAQEGSA